MHRRTLLIGAAALILGGGAVAAAPIPTYDHLELHDGAGWITLSARPSAPVRRLIRQKAIGRMRAKGQCPAYEFAEADLPQMLEVLNGG